MEVEETLEEARRFAEIARLVAEQNKDQEYRTYCDSNLTTEAFENNIGFDSNDNEYLQRVAEMA